MQIKLKYPIYAVLLLGVAVLIWACGSGSSGSSSSTTQSYSGPGSKWSSNINNDGTFTMNEADSSLALSGTWSTTAGGFKKLTVTSSSDTGSVAVGSGAYALDIPGTVLLVKPFNGTQMITMVKASECPQTDVTANWIMTNQNDSININVSDVMGTFAYTHSTTSAVLPTKYQLDGTPVAYGPNNDLGSFTCTDGVATIADGTMYLTRVGGAIVHTNDGTPGDATDDGFIVAMPTTNIGSLANLNGTYRGLVFADTSGVDELFPVAISLSNGTGTGNEINPDTGVMIDPIAVSLTAVDSPSDGFINGTIGGSTVRCMANTNVNSSGKNFVFCIGENPGEAGKLYNLLMISS
jgi:hypothetical protein